MSSSQDIPKLDHRRKRGDTHPFVFQIQVKKTKAVRPLDNHTFRLSVTTDADPTDATTTLFTLIGQVIDASTLVPVPTTVTGLVVAFPVDQIQADTAPGTYYFDVEMTYPFNATTVSETFLEGKWIVDQDRTK